MRILIVDDDLVSREKLKALLTPYGDCMTVPDGKWAMKKFKHGNERTRPFDLITVDIDMPEMSGHELVQEIRAWENQHRLYRKGKEAKILMVTSRTTPAEVIASFREGVEWYLMKPLTPESLDDALTRLEIEKRLDC